MRPPHGPSAPSPAHRPRARRARGGAASLPTAERVLDVAERLVQTQGFNGFSYADVAAELGITKASLHYHYPTKADLGASLVARYHAGFERALDGIDRSGRGARDRLRRYAQLYAEVLRRDRMCLCGMLAADRETLPRAMQEAVRRFFDMNEAWLARVLEGGREAGALRFRGDPGEAARLLLAALEGAMLVARSYGEVRRFEALAARLIGDLEADGARR